jgi:hypothetical protein
MNWIPESLDAPFFTRAETAKLFALLNSDRDVNGKTIGMTAKKYSLQNCPQLWLRH